MDGVHIDHVSVGYGEIRLVNGLQLDLSLTNHKCQPVLTLFHFYDLSFLNFPIFFSYLFEFSGLKFSKCLLDIFLNNQIFLSLLFLRLFLMSRITQSKFYFNKINYIHISNFFLVFLSLYSPYINISISFKKYSLI